MTRRTKLRRSSLPRSNKPLRRRRLVRPGCISDKVLDDAARAVVFARDGYRCVMCGTPNGIQWSHVRGRTFKSIQWLSLNAKALCGGCHKFKWHDPPPGFDPLAWFKQKYPGRLEEIDRIYFERKGTKLDREATLHSLRAELARLQGRAA
jgi:hypothetical protein